MENRMEIEFLGEISVPKKQPRDKNVLRRLRQKDLSCYRINEADDSLKVKSHSLCDGLYKMGKNEL